MKNKNWIASLIILIASIDAGATSTLQGNVSLLKENAGTYTVTITPCDTINAKIVGTFSDTKFVVPITYNDSAVVEISSLGYIPFQKQVAFDGSIVNLGNVALKRTGVELKELTVVGKKIKIESSGADYTVSNIQGTHLGDAGNLIDMLKWTPGIMVDLQTESIKVLGAGAPDVYINDRKIIDKSELNMLQSTQVSRIEVIRTPGAQYSNNTAAVIKIYLSRPLKDYIGASLTQNVTYNKRWSENTRLNLNMKSGIVQGSFALSYRYRNSEFNATKFDKITHSDNTIFTTNSASNHYYFGHSIMAFGGLNFNFSKNSVLGIQYSGNFNTTTRRDNSSKEYNENGIVTNKEIGTNGNVYGNSHTASISYSLKRNDKSSLMIVADYSTMPSHSNKTVEEKNLTTSEISSTPIFNHNKYSVYNLSADYSFSFLGKDENKIGTTGGYVNSNGGSSTNNEPDDSHGKNYSIGAYYSFKRWWGSFLLDAGLRYEYDNTRTTQTQIENTINCNYSNFLPTARILYKVNKLLAFSGTYRHFVSRPSYYDLNPTIYFQDSLNYSTGNPDLKPSYIDKIEFITNYNETIFRIGYKHYKDDWASVQTITPGSNILVTKPLNIVPYNIWYAMTDYFFNKDWFNMGIHAEIFLPNIKIPYLDQVRKINKVYGGLYGDFNFQVCKPLSLFFTANYNSGRDENVSHNGYTLQIDAGAQLALLKRKLVININAYDLLKKGSSSIVTTSYLNTYQDFRTKYDTRSINISIRYTINDIKSTFKSRGGNSDIFNRIQGGD